MYVVGGVYSFYSEGISSSKIRILVRLRDWLQDLGILKKENSQYLLIVCNVFTV